MLDILVLYYEMETRRKGEANIRRFKVLNYGCTIRPIELCYIHNWHENAMVHVTFCTHGIFNTMLAKSYKHHCFNTCKKVKEVLLTIKRLIVKGKSLEKRIGRG